MATGVLLLQVDGTDIDPIGGVFPNVRAARDFLVAEERSRTEDDPEDFEDLVAQLDAELSLARADLDDAVGISMQIESPFISMDLVFMSVEVRL